MFRQNKIISKRLPPFALFLGLILSFLEADTAGTGLQPESADVPGGVFSQPFPAPEGVLAEAPPEALSAALPGALSGENPEDSGESPPLFNRPLRKTPYERPGQIRFSGAAAEISLPFGDVSGFEAPLTQRYINQYSSPDGIAWLKVIMKRAEPYMAFIRRELNERNLPPELIYLPVIESGYLTTANSKSGAAGLWQFMRNSIDPFDISVNEWTDERMDFWKSTIGALRKLGENYAYFEDWPLALAAYNAGMGAIRGVVQKNGIKDYWILSEKNLLKTETRHYVPKLLAVSYILSHPRYFGVSASWPEDPEWTRVRVGRTVDLDLLAKEAGVDGAELKRANQELIYNVTPPDAAYHLKIPSRDAAALTAVLERRDLTLIRYYFHTIKAGDTLSVLAQHYGVSLEQITGYNPGVQARNLRIGSRLIIPLLKEVEPYRQERNTLPVFEGNHLVKRGETLWSIALTYRIDPEDLAEANGMELNDILREGRNLKTPIK